MMHESFSKRFVNAFDCWFRVAEKCSTNYVLEINNVYLLQISLRGKPWFKLLLMNFTAFKVPTEVHYSKLVHFAKSTFHFR
jgi:hypothetical protein